jgi:hypothetical protein
MYCLSQFFRALEGTGLGYQTSLGPCVGLGSSLLVNLDRRCILALSLYTTNITSRFYTTKYKYTY